MIAPAPSSAVLNEAMRPGVVQLATGAWYDPEDPAASTPFCVHGNPNVLMREVGTSRRAQSCTGQVALVEIECLADPPPSIKAFDPHTRPRNVVRPDALKVEVATVGSSPIPKMET